MTTIFIQRLIPLVLSLASEVTLSQAFEVEKSCDYPEVGLHFKAQLVRRNGLVSGYEMTVENKSTKDLVMEHPELAYEAADAIIFETPEQGGDRLQIDAEFLYPMHGPVENQQRWFRGKLRAGESKKFSVDMKDALKPGIFLRSRHSYDIRVLSTIFFKSSEIGGSIESFERVRNLVNFSGCMAYKDVRISVNRR